MQLNNVVFPAPECSYSMKDFPGEMIYLPRNYEKPDVQNIQAVEGDLRILQPNYGGKP